MKSRNRWIGYGGADTAVGDVGLLVLRVVPMLLLVGLHGLGKLPPQEPFMGWVGGMGFPAPALFAWLSALTEVVAAGLLLVGLLTRPLGLLLFAYFMIVVLVPHAGDALADRELPLIFGAIGLALGLVGPGRYSIDALLRRGRPDGLAASSG